MFLPSCFRTAGRPFVNVCIGNNAFFHSSALSRGFEEFFDKTTETEQHIFAGRAWTMPDLRRKNFEDLHKLWFVLYKERNLLLTTKSKLRRMQRPVSASEENRYSKVKRSMGAIKHVLDERRKIDQALGISTAIPQNYGGISKKSVN